MILDIRTISRSERMIYLKKTRKIPLNYSRSHMIASRCFRFEIVKADRREGEKKREIELGR